MEQKNVLFEPEKKPQMVFVQQPTFNIGVNSTPILPPINQ
jgi:hypothetical protein